MFSRGDDLYCISLHRPSCYPYYGIHGNYQKLEALYRHVARAWRYWLSRHGGPRTIPWATFANLRAVLALLLPRIVHHI
jgi:hypothetical protein